jgi:hypothetical protein
VAAILAKVMKVCVANNSVTVWCKCSVFAYRTHWVLLIWQMDLPHCMSMLLGVSEIIQNNSTVIKSGNYYNNFM